TNTRELSDALRRRCLYHYVDYPDVDRETRIVLAPVPGRATALARQTARLMESGRKEEPRKVPGGAEAPAWAAAPAGLDVGNLHDDSETVYETLRCLLKTQEDGARVTPEVAARLIGKVA